VLISRKNGFTASRRPTTTQGHAYTDAEKTAEIIFSRSIA